MPHEKVKHSAGEYVRGNVHTNNIESFWSLLKRGVVGTFGVTPFRWTAEGLRTVPLSSEAFRS